MIQTQTYSTNNITLNKEMLSVYINNFWVDIFKVLVNSGPERYLMLMCKVEFTDGQGYRSLGHLRSVNFSDKELFIEYLVQRLGVLTDAYSNTPIAKISFTYVIKNGKNKRCLMDKYLLKIRHILLKSLLIKDKLSILIMFFNTLNLITLMILLKNNIY
jgi:hypothetical protein